MSSPDAERKRRLRSENMAAIRGRDTTPELLLRRALWARGHRYRVNYRTTVGKVDIAFPRNKVAVLVDGCFWHGCPEHYVPPRSRADFWGKKLRANTNRDRRQTLTLEAEGWTVVRFWEHEVHTNLEGVVRAVGRTLNGVGTPEEPRWQVVQVTQSQPDGLETRYEEDLRDAGRRRVTRRERRTSKW